MSDYIAEQLGLLINQGCHPGLHWRSDKWRAHVNTGGNYWADSLTPDIALAKAVQLWIGAGQPMDGAAAPTPETDQ